MSSTTSTNNNLPPLPAYNPANFDPRFAQGLVGAMLAQVSPYFSNYLEEMTESQLVMMKEGLASAESQGNSALASGAVQGGISLVGSIADGVTAKGSADAMKEINTIRKDYETKREGIENLMSAADKRSSSIQMKPDSSANNASKKKTPGEYQEEIDKLNGKTDPESVRERERLMKEKRTAENSLQVNLEPIDENNPEIELEERSRPLSKEELQHLKEKHKRDLDDAFEKYKFDSEVASKRETKSKHIANAFSQAANTLGQPGRGLADRNSAIQQEGATIANSGAQQAQQAKDSSVSVFSEMLSDAKDVMGYGAAMVRG